MKKQTQNNWKRFIEEGILPALVMTMGIFSISSVLFENLSIIESLLRVFIGISCLIIHGGMTLK